MPKTVDYRGIAAILRLLILSLLAMPAWGMQNQLRDHPSPYLAMHGNDPVAWQDWSEDVLQQARDQDKLVFVSSGYFSCHWCHVMQRESYSSPVIAKLLNEHFIPVKLDRELHPALDAYLIDYVERTQGHAGWPLNIFLTPEGYPLIGTTYLPVDRFATLLTRLNATWDAQRAKTRNLARRALLRVIAKKQHGQVERLPAGQLRDSFLRQALALGDPMEGGFGEQNKFPMAPQLLAMLTLRGDKPHRALDTLLQSTLDQMASQGLRDHLGGGFYRYTVDPSWQVPHFEKMLYTQALLARIYLAAAERYGDQRYADIAAQTLDFVLKDMRGKDGMFIASLSAVDEKGEEGAVYLWQADELEQLLGKEDAALARSYWAMTGPPTVEGGYLPRRGEGVEALAKREGVEVPVMAERIADIQGRLLKARSQRRLPADTKMLAGWNGLVLGSLALAGEQLGRSDYLEAARELARTIQKQLWHDDTLWRSAKAGQPVGQASLADYAYLAEGLDLLASRVDEPLLAAWRDTLVEQAWRRFHGPRGWREAEKLPLPGIGESPALQDGALPASPAVVLGVTLRGDNPRLLKSAQEALSEAMPRIQEEPFWFPSWIGLPREDQALVPGKPAN